MTKKSRYLLIVLGFIIFLLLAPTIILYVSGITYDFAEHKFVQTGTLSVQSEPKKINVFLDGKLASKNGGNIKLLVPKEYNVKLEKQGFSDWTKRLRINPGQVTQVAGQAGKTFLLLKDPISTTLGQNVSDFASQGDNFAYVTQNELTIGLISNPAKIQTYSLPKPVNKIAFSSDGKFLVLTRNAQPPSNPATTLIFSQNTQNFSDLSPLFAQIPDIKFTADGQPFALENQTLYKLDLQQPAKTAVINNVLAFTFQDNNLYYIRNNDKNIQLIASQLPALEGLTLANGLPAFSQGRIFVSFTKSVMLLLDNTFYQVSSAAQAVASNVSQYNFNFGADDFIFFHDGDLSFFSPGQDGIQFITRSSSVLQSPVLKTSVGYAFAARGKTLLAVELDTRDHQNEYELYTGNGLQKFSVDKNAQNLLVLDGSELKKIQIR